MSNQQAIFSLLNEIYLILDDGDRRLFGRYNLTTSRYYALLHLYERPGISLSDLSNLMLCDKSNATRIIKGLETEGLVIRKKHETDGRAVRLYLSVDGQTLLKQAYAAHDIYNLNRFADLSARQQEKLVGILEQLKQTLLNNLAGNQPVGSTH